MFRKESILNGVTSEVVQFQYNGFTFEVDSNNQLWLSQKNEVNGNCSILIPQESFDKWTPFDPDSLSFISKVLYYKLNQKVSLVRLDSETLLLVKAHAGFNYELADNDEEFEIHRSLVNNLTELKLRISDNNCFAYDIKTKIITEVSPYS